MNEERIKNIKRHLKAITDLSGQMDTEAAADRIRAGVPFRGANVWILVCSIMIASAGLNINSTAVIIGAMLISPVMGPIIGAGMSLGTGDIRLLRYSAMNLLVMVVVSLLASTVFYILSPLALANPTELEARTAPTIYDVLIALFGGFAGILENSRKERGTVLSGVAIATALMPPLCTAGYGIAHLSWHYFGGAMYLFIINTFFIVLATYIGVRYFHFESVDGEHHRIPQKGRRIAAIIFAIILVPSIISAARLASDNKFQMRVEDFVGKHSVIANTYIYDFKVGPKRHTATISMAGDPMSDEDWVSFWEDARKSGLKKEQITIHQNTREMSRDQMMLMLQDVRSANEQSLSEKDAQIQSLQRSLDSLRAAVAEIQAQSAGEDPEAPEEPGDDAAPSPGSK